MKVFIFGAGGHAKITIDILELNGYSIVGLIDDNSDNKGKDIMGYTILGSSEIIPSLLETGVNKAFIAVGNNPARVRIGEKLSHMGFELINAIHPTSTISKHAHIGKGVMINARAVINANAALNDYVIINTNSVIEHDCLIDTGAHICPSVNLAGTVHVGKCSMVGIGSTVIDHITVGDNTIVGASSVVVKDIPNNVTAVGSPAKVIKQFDMLNN